MARSFTNSNQVTDLSEGFENIPNQWKLISALGIFMDELKSNKTVTFEELSSGAALLEDTPYDTGSDFVGQDSRRVHALAIPHFGLDAKLKKSEIADLRADGSDEEMAVLAAQDKILTRAKRSAEQTVEYARALMLTTGGVYAPNGTVSHNAFTEFGVTQKAIDFTFGGTTNVRSLAEEGIAHIQDTINSGEMIGRFVALCSPEFFGKLLDIPAVAEAYATYENTNQTGGRQVLRDRLGSDTDVRVRMFNHMGIEFIEYRATFKDKAGAVKRLIPQGEAVLFPVDTEETYKTFYAPADVFDVDQTRQMYTFEIKGHRVWEYESETNFLNWCHRPQVLVRLHSSN